MIAERIADYMEEKGVKQAAVAENMGLSPQALNMRLRHNRRISVGEYKKICDFLGVPYEKFLEDGDE